MSKLSDAAVTAPFDDQLSQNAQTLQPQNPYLCLVHEIDDLHENSSLSYMSCYYFAVEFSLFCVCLFVFLHVHV